MEKSLVENLIFPSVEVTVFKGDKLIKLKKSFFKLDLIFTRFSTDRMLEIGIKLEPDDLIRTASDGEIVYLKKIEKMTICDVTLRNITVEIGRIPQYNIDAIIGMDILVRFKKPDKEKKFLKRGNKYEKEFTANR